jgi:hypothetical protein
MRHPVFQQLVFQSNTRHHCALREGTACIRVSVQMSPGTGLPLAVFVANKEDIWAWSSPGQKLLSAEHAVTTRLLQGLGWQVVHLPAWFWVELGTPSLKAAIQKHLGV